MGKERRGHAAGRLMILMAALCWLSSVAPAGAQVARDDFARINQAYLRATQFAMNVTYRYYANHTSNRVLESSSGFIRRSGDRLASKQFGLEVVNTDWCKVSVDSESKAIFISDPDSLSRLNVVAVKIDSVLQLCRGVRYARVSDGQGRYTLQLPRPSELESVEIYFNFRTFFIERLSLHYRPRMLPGSAGQDSVVEAPRIEVEYQGITLQPRFDQGTFSADRFVTVRDGNLAPVGEYADYQCFDSRKRR